MFADLSPYFVQWLTLIAVFAFAVISPGPDFVVSVRNSVVYSRRVGIFTAAGFGLGMLVHATYTILGFAAIIAQSILLFNVIKVIGSAYLIYLGVQGIRSHGIGKSVVDEAIAEGYQNVTNRPTMTDRAALRSGFLTNVFNPKAALFFLAIFSQIIRPDTPVLWQIIYVFTCGLMIFSWFSFVAYALNLEALRQRFIGSAQLFDRICGGVLIALGIKIVFSSRS